MNELSKGLKELQVELNGSFSHPNNYIFQPGAAGFAGTYGPQAKLIQQTKKLFSELSTTSQVPQEVTTSIAGFIEHLYSLIVQPSSLPVCRAYGLYTLLSLSEFKFVGNPVFLYLLEVARYLKLNNQVANDSFKTLHGCIMTTVSLSREFSDHVASVLLETTLETLSGSVGVPSSFPVTGVSISLLLSELHSSGLHNISLEELLTNYAEQVEHPPGLAAFEKVYGFVVRKPLF